MDDKELLECIRKQYLDILGNKLVGIYVHGSIAFECFNPQKSDIDFLVVVNKSLVMEEKERLIRILLELDKFAPEKGLEMSVVLEQVCKEFEYPTPFLLHFSNMHKNSFREDLTGTCLWMNGQDKDLAAHFTVIKSVGYALYGAAVSDVFGVVPEEAYLDSIKYDVEDAENEVQENPIYIILNLCRVLAYVQDRVILSKKQGGLWGAEHLPKEFNSLILEAVKCYCSDETMAADETYIKKFVSFTKKHLFD